ncbi:MAG: GIY-YIG nuclease family protein [Bacteroidetes bacterium]|nr:GIY-YIG nuclease family protein [Bacteroidota bacterium]MBK9798165.1 GIY-YIG nuclease family protein [Bacteroidota bacterium]
MLKYFFTYILECSDKSYYTGITNDIDRRLAEHNEGENPIAYTFSRRPVKLVYVEQFLQPDQAIEFEKQIKGWSRKKKEALIEDNWDKIKELAVCKNKTSHLNSKK